LTVGSIGDRNGFSGGGGGGGGFHYPYTATVDAGAGTGAGGERDPLELHRQIAGLLEQLSAAGEEASCAFFDRIMHSRMPLVPIPPRLKRPCMRVSNVIPLRCSLLLSLPL
jgi:hypothetical protein